MKNKIWFLLFASWWVAAISTFGSLFFSEVMKYPPCILCWYQRIFMYPLVIILFLGLFPLDKNVLKFSLPLAGLGWVIAIYHNLLYYRFLPESLAPCVQGISCTTVQVSWFGFITIPLLSLLGFTLIIFFQILIHRISFNEK